MDQETKKKIEDLLGEKRVVLFMKGNPSFPQCGFSARAVAILRECGADFASCDVLENEDIRGAIKEYGNWPTIPQLYIDRKLVGGSDIMMEMFEAGELQSMIKT
jgi:monothiol glutaredoxin